MWGKLICDEKVGTDQDVTVHDSTRTQGVMQREVSWPRVLRILTTDSLSDNESLEVNVVDSVGVEVVVVEDRLGDCNNEPGWARNQEPIYHVCYAIVEPTNNNDLH